MDMDMWSKPNITERKRDKKSIYDELRHGIADSKV